MAQVFLSYARRDLPALQPLLQDLGAHGITVWRDQDSLYGGQQWPKAIGEAIAAHDVLLLVWSQEAAASHFVEFEWNTALALQKNVLPCLLDQTPLPSALRAINGIDARLPHRGPAKDSACLTTAGHTPQGRAERQGYHDLRGDHRYRPCRSCPDR